MTTQDRSLHITFEVDLRERGNPIPRVPTPYPFLNSDSEEDTKVTSPRGQTRFRRRYECRQRNDALRNTRGESDSEGDEEPRVRIETGTRTCGSVTGQSNDQATGDLRGHQTTNNDTLDDYLASNEEDAGDHNSNEGELWYISDLDLNDSGSAHPTSNRHQQPEVETEAEGEENAHEADDEEDTLNNPTLPSSRLAQRTQNDLISEVQSYQTRQSQRHDFETSLLENKVHSLTIETGRQADQLNRLASDLTRCRAQIRARDTYIADLADRHSDLTDHLHNLHETLLGTNSAHSDFMYMYARTFVEFRVEFEGFKQDMENKVAELQRDRDGLRTAYATRLNDLQIQLARAEGRNEHLTRHLSRPRW